MKKYLLPLLLLFVINAKAQLLTWTPDFIKETSSSITITMDASYGNRGLYNYTPTSDVYVHVGVVTNLSNGSWSHVKFSFTTADAAAHATYLGNNKWSYTISSDLRTFFGVTNSAETILKIGILFRRGDGNSAYVQRNRDGSDMYIPVYDNGLYTRIDVPYQQPTFYPVPEPVLKVLGDNFPVTIKASQSSTLSILFNGLQIATGSGTVLSSTASITAKGVQTIIGKATNGTATAADTTQFTVAPTITVAPVPAGDSEGINYESTTSVVLVLYAPLKDHIYVEGDFNNWKLSNDLLMNKTSDGNYFWVRIAGLTPGREYAYQYLIDDTLKVADYNCEKILDPDNDQYISSATYPNLRAYPTGQTSGIVSVLQTAKPAYTWQVNKFARPIKQNLAIYELLVRDFTAAGNFQTLIDTLNYIQKLGVNAIEVMPFNEFEGNNSWGYNPSFYFAPDKAYGPENVVKKFIDECHKRGIAVIMDMVMNHSFGQSPMVQMYFDNNKGVPATNSPWFNQYAKHAYNVGYDFNHESAATQSFVQRVINFWLTDYKVDGFRWDLAKGFTQKQTCDATGGNCDVNAWGAYDATRVAIWQKYYGNMQSSSAGSYCILEMFADNSEEKVESDNGMMLWGNENYSYNQATMGYKDGWDFSYGIYTNHGFAQPNLVTYQESHDEERLMYKNEQYGASNATYNVKNIPTGLARNGMAAAFWSMQPGPKMMWEFGELGYDLSINTCANGTVNNDCRTDPKPPHWEYLNDVNRKTLYNIYSSLLRLKTYPGYANTFAAGTPAYNLADSIKWESLKGSNLQVMVFGNFGISTKSGTVTFPSTGKWYSYLTDDSITVTSVNYAVTLAAGRYGVFTNKKIRNTVLALNELSLSLQRNGAHSILLNWTAESKTTNNYFDVERSTDGATFTKIGSVKASADQQYSFIDNIPFNGTNYYRIKQVDKDGNTRYSSIQKIDITEAIKRWNLYPNPAVNSSTLIALNNYSKASVTVSNMNGKIVYTTTVNNIAAAQQIKIPLQQLSKGVYLVKVVTGNSTDVEKLVVE